MHKNYSPTDCHNPLLQNIHSSLNYEECGSQPGYPEKVRTALKKILGQTPKFVDPNLIIEKTEEKAGYKKIRFSFSSEIGADVPCHLLLPSNASKPVPIIICLQGHSPGMHLSLGRAKNLKEQSLIKGGDRDYALQAVDQGFAAVVLEQRAFGERMERGRKKYPWPTRPCTHPSMVALLLGRTMIGERVWDVQRLIDILGYFPELDLNRLGCLGNSGGGTIAYYAACLDQRIKAVMPSSAICSVVDSIGTIDHCPDNYLPGFLTYFDMGDLACLIAPRPLIIVAGKKDHIFPLSGVLKEYQTIETIYQDKKAAEQCRLVIGEAGHRFYAQKGWEAFRETAGW